MTQGCELERTLDRFLRTITLTLRPNTVVEYRYVIALFIRFLRREHPSVSSFWNLKRQHIEAWLRHLGERELKRSTKRRSVVEVRSFLEKIRSWGWPEAPEDVLFQPGDLPPPDRYLPRPLSEETDRALRKYLGERGGLIPRALLLLRGTGLRCQELLDLEVDALEKLSDDRWALHVPLGKLHSERVIPVDAVTARVFEEIRELRGNPPSARDPETGKPLQYLIVRPDGSRPTALGLRYHLRMARKRARLEEHPTPHRLRHTFATEMLRAGMRLPVLMKLLGHRTIDMTLRYAEVTGIDVQRAYLDTRAALERRYELPRLPAAHRPSNRNSARRAILTHVETLAAELEAFRRDYGKKSEKKRLQRFVERLRRLAMDFKSLRG